MSVVAEGLDFMLPNGSARVVWGVQVHSKVNLSQLCWEIGQAAGLPGPAVLNGAGDVMGLSGPGSGYLYTDPDSIDHTVMLDTIRAHTFNASWVQPGTEVPDPTLADLRALATSGTDLTAHQMQVAVRLLLLAGT